MQRIDALFEAMSVREMQPRIDFARRRTRIYVGRKIGVHLFDIPDPRGQAFFQFVNYLDARQEYHYPDCVAAGTTFEIVCNDDEEAFKAYYALRPLLRAINTYKPDLPDTQTPMSLGL